MAAYRVSSSKNESCSRVINFSASFGESVQLFQILIFLKSDYAARRTVHLKIRDFRQLLGSGGSGAARKWGFEGPLGAVRYFMWFSAEVCRWVLVAHKHQNFQFCSWKIFSPRLAIFFGSLKRVAVLRQSRIFHPKCWWRKEPLRCCPILLWTRNGAKVS